MNIYWACIDFTYFFTAHFSYCNSNCLAWLRCHMQFIAMKWFGNYESFSLP